MSFLLHSGVDTFHHIINYLLCICTSDSPDCGCGLMSVERMNILLGLESVGYAVTTAQRQQITPAINFTCDGMITKWIIGAVWRGQFSEESLYPELQVWRNIGNDMYQMIHPLIFVHTH